MREILSKIAEVDYYVRWYSRQHDRGIWASRQLGGAAEFETITEYELGDNPRSINWSATARTGGHRILKNTRLTEANLAVFLVVDLTPSMDFGTVRTTKRRLAAEISAVLAHAAWRCGDRVGFIGYGSGVEVEWPLRNARDYRLLIPEKILQVRSHGNGESGLGRALVRLPQKRSLVFIVSDFQDDLEELEIALKPVAITHDVVPLVLWDPRERILPRKRCVTVVKDLETGTTRTVWLGGIRKRTAFQRKAEAMVGRLKALFHRLGMDALWISQETDYVGELGKFFSLRRRAG
ncbi:MAG: DUF58 domain-containing protein [Deltaproteobacteria bacterium]|nr:DUF58 domain-containing protein [Deltaproteobacteria bacterium]MBW2120253.1 DUF58 domain-containing protein [Deltaproteobacteria bacterium]